MKRHELIVIGAGPAGLSAAIEAKKNGMDVIVFDENQRPGGQLFKQIHKFFGSKEHHAKTRGFIIGQQLLKEAEDLGVRVELDSTVMGIYENKEVTVKQNGEVHHYKGDAIIIATGAAENMIPFKGWNIPGVIGAGAAQTMMNIQGVQPAARFSWSAPVTWDWSSASSCCKPAVKWQPLSMRLPESAAMVSMRQSWQEPAYRFISPTPLWRQRARIVLPVR